MNNKKKIIIIVSVLIFTIVIVSACFIVNYYLKTISIKDESNTNVDMSNLKNAKTENGLKINTSDKIKEDKEYEGIVLSGISLDSKNDETNLYGTITNKTQNTLENKLIKINLINENNQKEGTIYVQIDNLEPGASQTITGTIDKDYLNISDCYIEI